MARLSVLRSDLIDPTIALHRGNVVMRAGDPCACRDLRRGRVVVNCELLSFS
jgi:hypothetical protein